mmetsp:Transcript_31978/g.47734  ORF Transcript_31978/g.47734 Transcript_31978/m.47734 type:complete len:96 (+) Transcript_31978:533-820(+)
MAAFSSAVDCSETWLFRWLVGAANVEWRLERRIPLLGACGMNASEREDKTATAAQSCWVFIVGGFVEVCYKDLRYLDYVFAFDGREVRAYVGYIL